MKTHIFIIALLLSSNLIFATNVDSLFTYDEAVINEQFEEIDELEKLFIANPDTISYFRSEYESNELFNNLPVNIQQTFSPWNLPSFWFAFVISAVGTYTLYGIPAAPISVTIVYLSSKGDKQETKRAVIGCISGIVVGGALKYFIMNL